MEFLGEQEAPHTPWSQLGEAMTSLDASQASRLGRAFGHWYATWQGQTTQYPKSFFDRVDWSAQNQHAEFRREVVFPLVTARPELDRVLLEELLHRHFENQKLDANSPPFALNHPDLSKANILVSPGRDEMAVVDTELVGPVRGTAVGCGFGGFIANGTILQSLARDQRGEESRATVKASKAFVRAAVQSYLNEIAGVVDSSSTLTMREVVTGVMLGAATLKIYVGHRWAEKLGFSETARLALVESGFRNLRRIRPHGLVPLRDDESRNF